MALSAPMMLERIVHWTMNGQSQAPFLCTPDAMEDMISGYLLSAGIIRGLQDIESLQIADEHIAVRLKQRPLPHLPIDQRLERLLPLESPLKLPLSALRACADRLTSEESFFGTHRIMLTGAQGELAREDIGRHNAADKVIGAAFRAGWDLAECALGATGRISLEILCKAAAMGIPIIFSKKYPSDLSCEWAQKLNIAIVGKIQSDSPEICGAVWRVET